MIRDPNLNALVYFQTVARLGRVTKAAEELGVSASAVSQQIRLLEQQFGVRLFRRHKQRLSLTLDGDRLYQTTTGAFRSIRDVHTAIVRQRESHHLNLRVSPSFGVRWLGPRLAGFASANPQWDLRIDATPDFTDFDTEVVDVDLRYGAGDWPGLHTECMVRDLVLPMCSPDYLAGLQKMSDDPHEQLRAARLIDSVKTLIRWDAWLPRNSIGDVKRVYAYRFDRSSMAIQFAKDERRADGTLAALCAAVIRYRAKGCRQGPRPGRGPASGALLPVLGLAGGRRHRRPDPRTEPRSRRPAHPPDLLAIVPLPLRTGPVTHVVTAFPCGGRAGAGDPAPVALYGEGAAGGTGNVLPAPQIAIVADPGERADVSAVSVCEQECTGKVDVVPAVADFRTHAADGFRRSFKNLRGGDSDRVIMHASASPPPRVLPGSRGLGPPRR